MKRITRRLGAVMSESQTFVPIDRPTDRPIDEADYRVACTRLQNGNGKKRKRKGTEKKQNGKRNGIKKERMALW